MTQKVPQYIQKTPLVHYGQKQLIQRRKWVTLSWSKIYKMRNF